MKIKDEFKILGINKKSDQSIELSEISILANPKTIKKLGLFLIKSAMEMKSKNSEHIHLQDRINNFSTQRHVDIILNNENNIKLNVKFNSLK